MANYRCYVFDSADEILEIEDIEGNSDEDAIEKSQERRSQRSAFELWKRDRLIHRHDLSAAAD